MTTKDLEAARWRFAAAIFIWRKSVMAEGKDEFYPKVYEALTKAGFQVFSGKEIPGKGRSHASKPDYIAVKGNMVVIGEIKAPAEPPTSSSWRQIQNSDTEQFAAVRLEVAKREKAGLVKPEVGGHEIIIRGQIEDYVRKIGVNYDLPVSVPKNMEMQRGYAFPESEEQNVKEAIKNNGKKGYEKIDNGNGSITYLLI